MKYFSMFSGIGGFEYGIEQAYSRLARERERDSGSSRRREEIDRERAGIPQADRDMYNDVFSQTTENYPTCIGYSEINKYASAIYSCLYPNHKNYGNAKDLVPGQLPDFDLLVGGFPCQAFSIAGKRGGFNDTRGTLFFDVARVLKAKKPQWFLLENVKGLCSHEGGKTLATIYKVLVDLGYTVGWQVVNSCHFGVPQNRERIFIVGHLTEAGGRVGEILPVGRADQQAKYQIRQVAHRKGYNNNTRTFHPEGMAGTIDTSGGGGRELHVAESLQGNDYANTIRGGGRDSMTKKHNWDYVKINRKDNKKNQQDIVARLTGGSNSGGNHSDMDLLVHYGHKDKPVKKRKICPTLKAESHGHQPMVKAVLTPDRLNKGQNGRRFKDKEEPSFTLTAQDKHGVQVGTEIRRLTPIECERLQGFPDDWTKYGTMNGEQVEISDTQRYKALGNAVTVNVVEHFMLKILTAIEL